MEATVGFSVAVVVAIGVGVKAGVVDGSGVAVGDRVAVGRTLICAGRCCPRNTKPIARISPEKEISEGMDTLLRWYGL